MKKIFKQTVKNFVIKVNNLSDKFDFCPSPNFNREYLGENITVCLFKQGEEYKVGYFYRHVSLGEIKDECVTEELVNYCYTSIDEYVGVLDVVKNGKLHPYHRIDGISIEMSDEAYESVRKMFNLPVNEDYEELKRRIEAEKKLSNEEIVDRMFRN